MDQKVSVLIITYNHEKYIAQAVESALQQEVEFPVEIVIGDDCSTDHTREILEKLGKAYPERIRLLLRDKKGEGLPGKMNFVETLEACRGQFVALLDGDDYWTNNRKLQKQVEFLESNPEYALCFHNANIARDGATANPDKFSPADQKETSTLEDLLKGNFIFASSTMFRRGLFGKLPEWFHKVQTGDWVLHLLNAQHGKIGYLNEVMAVYRMHGDSWWSSKASSQRLIDQINLLDQINGFLGFRYDKQIKATQCRSCAEVAEIAFQGGDLINARAFLTRCVKMGLGIHRLPTTPQLKRLARLYNPTLYKLVRSLRN